MQPGALDRRVTIQQATTTQDIYGEPIETWATIATVWAKQSDIRGRERFTSETELAVRTATFRIYWMDGIDEKMRLIDADGTVYEIEGIAGDKRQNWLELSCEAKNPEVTG